MNATLSIFFAACMAGSASAQITYVTQVRSVEVDSRSTQAQGSPILDSDRVDATDFGPFQADFTVTTSSSIASGGGNATQDSDLDATSISASGYGTGWGTGSDPNGYGSGSGDSDFDVTFDLTTEADVTLTGSLSISQFGTAIVEFSSQQAGSLYFGWPSFGGSTVPINETFTLPPGRYSVSASASGYGYGDPWIGEMEDGRFQFLLRAVARPVGASDCSPPSVNSNSTRATLDASGTRFVSSADLTLHVEGAIPGEAGLFFYGTPQAPAPFGGGTLCLGGTLFRLSSAIQSGALGDASHVVDFNAWPVSGGPGAFVGGSTWAFQYWYRDPGDPAGFSASERYTITFQ